MRLFYFGNEKQKSDAYFEIIFPLLSKYLRAGSYFVRRDWNGGPNYKIIFQDQVINLDTFNNEYLTNFSNSYLVSHKALHKNIIAYKNLSATIGELERTDARDIDANNHLKTSIHPLDITQIKKIYDSENHFKLQFEALSLAQIFVTTYAKKIRDTPLRRRYILLMQLMRVILKYSKLPDKYAMVTYLSNSEGVLAIAKQNGLGDQFLHKYNLLYDALPIDELAHPEKAFAELIEDWKELFDKINEKFHLYMEQGEVYEDGYYSKEERHNELLKNMAKIESDFHEQALMQHLNIIENHKMQQDFRFLVNIEYQILHMMDITFKERAFLCHALCRAIMAETNTSWQEIIAERNDMLAAKNEK
jgi:hypothetical protein